MSRSRNRTATRRPGSRHHDGLTLLDAVRLWPTPTAANPNDGETLASFKARKARERAKGRNGNGIGTPLGVAVRLWPTPKASDGDGSGGSTRDRGRRWDLADHVAKAQQAGTLLNPAWVEALMGFPPGWTAPATPAAGPRRPARPPTPGSRPAPSPAGSPAAPPG